ncbi:UNVERIFIED_CONTAM: hypothetical protein GTU68_010883, partial [Idotea baltica]|nr:hypothetical protein [Idotea baltica]
MGADQFLLTWNNHRSNFAEVFSQLRIQDQLVDVTLLCDGGSYPAHRLVLAACSPYFHQLFTKLPTQHPLVYLRDVRQAELEALLEFIYRGEVSVANSELTGLIKIAESLRIKGLGDVSQRDPAPSTRAEKRSTTPFSNASSPNSCGRPRKAPRLASMNGNSDKNVEGDFPSLISPSAPFSLRSQHFSHMLDNPVLATAEADQDSRDSSSPPFKESKLRSCLEGPELPLGLPLSNLLAQSSGASRLGSLLRKEAERKKVHRPKGKMNPSEQLDQENEAKNLFNDVKQENLSGEEASNPLQNDQEAMILPQFPKLYDSGEFGSSFLTKYTQLLSSFHQQQQQQQQQQSNQQHLAQPNLSEEETGPSFTSLIPTTVQEHQIPPSPKDAKSLTCHLCGATIKHIANFRRHMKQHLNPRRFPCPWCSAAFGRKDNLKTHTRQ